MMHKLLIILLLALLALPGAPSAVAQTGPGCFAETGYCASGRFLDRN